MTALDRYDILTDDIVDRIVARVMERLDERQRAFKVRQREAVLMELRALEDDLKIERSRPTKRERE